MRRLKKLVLAVIVMALMVAVTVEIFAAQSGEQGNITVRKAEAQTVLYTIYRGEYQKIGRAIGNLYGLAMKNQAWPRGSLSCVYLNNPQYVSAEHCLVEIRIPVGEEALKLAGTLGEMTDVKTVKEMDVAVVTKQPGQTDHDSVYNILYTWVSKNGYVAADNACEVFASNMQSQDYSQMKSDIMVPVRKIPTEN